MLDTVLEVVKVCVGLRSVDSAVPSPKFQLLVAMLVLVFAKVTVKGEHPIVGVSVVNNAFGFGKMLCIDAG